MQKLLPLIALFGLTLGTVGCTPPATDDVDISTDTVAPAATPNDTLGAETPNATLGSETPAGETP